MSARKRPSDGDESSEPQRSKIHRQKAPQRSNEDFQKQSEIQDVTGSSLEDQFNIEIKLRSASKAAQNDPKPPGYWTEKLGTLALEDSSSPKSEQTSEAEAVPASSGAQSRYATATKAEIVPADIVGASSTAVAGQNKANLEPPEFEDIEDEYNFGEFEDDTTEASYDSDKSEYDEFAEFGWLEEIEGFVTYTKGSSKDEIPEQIGYCEAKLIRRNQIRAIFYDSMEEPSRETSILAFELFDRYGRLKTQLKEHPIRKGSGIWNNELDCGDILLIEYLHIHKQYRRCGLGKKLVTAMLEKVREKTEHFFAIAWPTLLNTREMQAEMNGKSDAENNVTFEHELGISIQVFRSLGFRRIGSTCWFGLSTDPSHPSQLLSANDDHNPTVSKDQVPNLELELLQKKLAELEDIECVQILEETIQKKSATEPYWVLADIQGNTLLHTAAVNLKERSVDWIMNHDFGSHLLGIRNNEGDTPLEALLIELELARTQGKLIPDLIAHTSDKFKGYSTSAVSCIVRLRGLVATNMTNAELLRVSTGCTCGQCVMGLLSPRMCLALDGAAGLNHDLLSHGLESYSGTGWVEFNEDELQYLPGPVRDNLKTNKSMRQGFTNICLYIATCVREKLIPVEANVLAIAARESEWPPVTRNFLQRGGSVASVASWIFEFAMNNDEWAGDGQHAEIFEKEISELPECRNDHEYGFVSGMCGYKRVSNIRHVSLSGELLEFE